MYVRCVRSMRRMRVDFIEIEDPSQVEYLLANAPPGHRHGHSCFSTFVMATGTRIETETATTSWP